MLVVVSGYRSSGKETAGRIFCACGYRWLDVSEHVLKPEALWRGIRNLPDLLQLYKNLGNEFFVNEINRIVPRDAKACVTSVRHVDLYKGLREARPAELIWIDSDSEARFRRYLSRKRQGDVFATVQEFLAFEGEEDAYYRMHELRKLADYAVENNGTLESFEAEMRRIAAGLQF